jgi:hypothetical protein
MRPLTFFALLLAACAPAAAVPTVAIPTTTPAAPPDSAAPARPAEHRSGHVRGPLADRLSKAVRASSAGGYELELEASGRLVLRDRKDNIEEETYLEDVERVDYEHNPRFAKGEHWVRIYINQAHNQRTRWRQGKGEWMLATRPFLVIPFHDKDACDDALDLWKRLLAP